MNSLAEAQEQSRWIRTGARVGHGLARCDKQGRKRHCFFKWEEAREEARWIRAGARTGRMKPRCHNVRGKECVQEESGSAPSKFPKATGHERDIATRHGLFNLGMGSTRRILSPVSSLTGPWIIFQFQINVDKQGKKHNTRPLQSQQARLR